MDYQKYVRSWPEARDLFRKWREEPIRRSKAVVGIWEDILKSKIHKLGDENYLVLEQVCVAALDCNRIDIANDCLYDLSSQFPGSMRVLLLQSLKFEAMHRYEEALELLETLINRDETHPAPRKRRVAILKAKGKIPEAIKELNEYLKKFMIDQEAWQELCELYLMEQDFGKAAFCMEELILHNPHNHLFHQRLAEIRYTQGGFDNLEMARAYFNQALKLNPYNMRALYGILLTSVNIASSQKCTSAKKKEANNTVLWAMKQINERYSEISSEESAKIGCEEVTSLQKLVGSLQITAPSSQTASSS